MDGDNIFGTPSIDVSTLDTQSNEGGNQAENTAGNTTPESGQGAAVNETEKQTGNTAPDNGQGEGTDAGASEPQTKETTQLILGSFKTQEELKKAHYLLARKIESEQNLSYGQIKQISDDLIEDYQNLRAYYSQYKQSKANQANKQVDSKQTGNQQESDADYEARLIEWYNQELEKNPVNANAVLANYIAEKRVKELTKDINPYIENQQQAARLSSIKDEFSDIGEYSEQMTEEIQAIYDQNPEYANMPEKELSIVRDAYFKSKTKALESKVTELSQKLEQAFENGRQAGIQGIDTKKKINNEINGKKQSEGDEVPPGITLINSGDMLL